MEVEKLLTALEETVAFLRNSQSSNWASMSIDEMIQELESEVAKGQNAQLIDIGLLGSLFAPTGPIQETSLDNGWENEFLRLATVVDQFKPNQ